jgi:hypothetical protein
MKRAPWYRFFVLILGIVSLGFWAGCKKQEATSTTTATESPPPLGSQKPSQPPSGVPAEQGVPRTQPGGAIEK